MPTALDRAALLAAVCADPASDVPRLVFADFLDEQGEAERAEFIRVQVELARPSGCATCGGRRWYEVGDESDDCVYCTRGLRARERELLSGGGDGRHQSNAFRWLEPLTSLGVLRGRPWGEQAAFRRGFVASVTLALADWERHGAALARACPLEEVRLADREPQDYHNNSDNPGAHLFGFFGAPDDPLGANPHHLPRSLWEVLAGEEGCEVHRGWADFRTRPAATAALSRACLRLARAGDGP